MAESAADIKFFNTRPSNSSSASGEPAKPIPKFNPEDVYYDMSGEKILLIFNHYQYETTRHFKNKKPASREGTYEDVITLRRVFGNLGFKVITHTDLIHDKILEITRDISALDHSQTSCLAFAILTHGDTDGKLYAADKPYHLKDIVNTILHGDISLVTKPKLFIIQACRGAKIDKGRRVHHDGGTENTIVVPSHVDFLVMQSSVEDYLSWKDGNGSWLVQEFCNIVEKYHENMDILQLITLSNRSIAYNRETNTPLDPTTHKTKQTPETRYTLTKFLKL